MDKKIRFVFINISATKTVTEELNAPLHHSNHYNRNVQTIWKGLQIVSMYDIFRDNKETVREDENNNFIRKTIFNKHSKLISFIRKKTHRIFMHSLRHFHMFTVSYCDFFSILRKRYIRDFCIVACHDQLASRFLYYSFLKSL